MTALSDGPHTFEVRAIDPAGNIDASPARRTITVDTAAPQTAIDTGPSGRINDASPSFGFSASEAGGSFECRLDGPSALTGTWAACSSPRAYSNLAEGAYTFIVRASDAAGNTDPTPATRSITLTLRAPAAPSVPAPTPTATTPTNSDSTTVAAATDPDGDGIRNDWVIGGQTAPPPKAPTATRVGATMVRLALPKRPAGSKLRVYVRVVGGKFRACTTTKRRSATVRGLKAGRRYEFKIVAVDQAGRQSKASRRCASGRSDTRRETH